MTALRTVARGLAAAAMLAGAVRAQTPPAGRPVEEKSAAARARREKTHEIYLKEALGYTIYRDASRAEKAELRREPVYIWTNIVRDGGQDGEVFIWTCRGRVEALGTFFSFPQEGSRNLAHELHSLSLAKLDVDRPGQYDWHPQAPGIEPKPIAGAPKPGRTPAQRLSQMRALTREFSAGTNDREMRHWELRLLPQPLYRYESTDPDVLDGAVFCYVTSAGTDPEVLLILEARKSPGAAEPTWQYALARFTDLELTVKHKDKVLLKVPLIPPGAGDPDPIKRYRLFVDRQIPAVEVSAEGNKP